MNRIMFRYRLLHGDKVIGAGIAADPARCEYRIMQAYGKGYVFEWLRPPVTLPDAQEWEREEVKKLRQQGIDPVPQPAPPLPQAAAMAH